MTKDKPKSSNVVMPDHYRRFPIEPIRFCEENGLSPLQGKVVKYVCRYQFKNGLEDLLKAKRCIEMLIAKTKGDEFWWEDPAMVPPKPKTTKPGGSPPMFGGRGKGYTGDG